MSPVPRRLSPTLDPRLELLVLDPPEVVAAAFGLTGTPRELTVSEADRLEKKKV